MVVPKQYIYYSNKGKGETPGENKTKQEISKKSVTKQSIPSSQTATPKPREPKEKYGTDGCIQLPK